jgi:hypothetical protein
MSVNNFSRNRLFARYALEDLAEMLKLKILVFETSTEKTSETTTTTTKQCRFRAPENEPKIYEPINIFNLQLNDYVYLSASDIKSGASSSFSFTWLMCKAKQHVIQSTLLSTENRNKYFVRLQHQPFFYTHQASVLNRAYLFKCFSHECLLSNMCIFLYLRFLGECAVHNLVSLNELNFSKLVQTRNVREMCSYLNRLLGERYFNYQHYVNFSTFANSFKKPVNIF